MLVRCIDAAGLVAGRVSSI